jgi:hypothetical protein
MAIALEPSETKGSGSSTPVVYAGVTEEGGESLQAPRCPGSGQHLPDASGTSWAPSGWAW